MSGLGKNRVSPEPLEDVDDVEHVDLPEDFSPRKLQQHRAQGWEEEQTPSPRGKGKEEELTLLKEDSAPRGTQEDTHHEEEQEPPEKENETAFFDKTEHSRQLADDDEHGFQDKPTKDLRFRTTRLQEQTESPSVWEDPPTTSSQWASDSQVTQGDTPLSLHHRQPSDDHQEETTAPNAGVLYTSSGLARGMEDIQPVQPSPVQSSTALMAEQRGQQPSSQQAGHDKTHHVQDFQDAGGKEEGGGCCSIILTIFSYLLVAIFFPFSLFICIKVVQEYERAVIFRLGRLLSGGAKGPGIFFVLPCIEDYTKVDLRTITFDIPPQELLTRDSVTVSVDAVVYYRIYNPTVSVANVANAAHSTQLLAQTTLRNVLGTKNLGQILSDRDQISDSMQTALDDATDKWGIKVERVEIKDVRLPVQLQRAMAAEAEAAREARAKVIAAEGEQKASLALKEASLIISQSPAALQLRYLQTLNSISAEKNSTIIFPLPIDMMKAFMK